MLAGNVLVNELGNEVGDSMKEEGGARRVAYANGFQNVEEAWKVGDAAVESFY